MKYIGNITELEQNPMVVLPLTLEWDLTKACNLHCKYCTQYKPEYSDIDYSEILDKAIKLAPKHIWLGGGEPTLVKQLPEITKKLKKELNAQIGINTNLTKIEIASEILPFIDDIIVSIDTLDNKVSNEWRGVDPKVIIDNIKTLSQMAEKNKYKVAIAVISVVFNDALQGNGIEDLNDALFKIDENIQHMFCPLYPESKSDSIINDKKAAKIFFQIFDRLKKKNRRVKTDFPASSKEEKFLSGPIKCYRRYFRVGLETNKKFFSPCPPADPSNPICCSPCNCAAFIDEVLFAKNKETIEHPFLKRRLSFEEVARLRAFVIKYINSELPDDIYEDLLKNSLA